jgi:superfamily II RNA helicase
MIQELSDKVWENSRFHQAARSIEEAWLRREFRIEDRYLISEEIAKRAMEAAAILACSKQLERRRAAHRIATSVFELFETSSMPFDAALRVVLTRLENFPAIDTREEVAAALPALPWTLAADEIRSADALSVVVNETSIRLSSFQFKLWMDLLRNRSIALSALTSTGKSFVLQTYIGSKLNDRNWNIVYLVPTRALIAQVSLALSNRFKAHAPNIVTVPLRPGSAVPEQGIYVMTQERVNLVLDRTLTSTRT